MSDGEILLELAPYILSAMAMGMVFLLLAIRMVVSSRRMDKIQEKRKKRDVSNLEQMDSILRRSADLQKRIQNLEEIVYQK